MFTVEKRFKNANIRKTVRFPDELLDRVIAFQEKSGVSFNELILRCCEYALDNAKTDET